MHTVSREELYEQVWARPMTRVATDYGVTSTALKKTCDRHKIPTPDRGYWAKLEHSKPVRKKPPLPRLAETKLDQVHINGTPSESLSEDVRKAETEVRARLQSINLPDATATAARAGSDVKEPSILSATRRAISKGRPDAQGFKSIQGRGIVPLKIAPNSIDRALQLLTRIFALAEAGGYHPKISDAGLELVTEDVAIAIGVEERPRKTPHEPTAAELKRKEDNLRWGIRGTPGRNTTIRRLVACPSSFKPIYGQGSAAPGQTARRKKSKPCCQRSSQAWLSTGHCSGSAGAPPRIDNVSMSDRGYNLNRWPRHYGCGGDQTKRRKM